MVDFHVRACRRRSGPALSLALLAPLIGLAGCALAVLQQGAQGWYLMSALLVGTTVALLLVFRAGHRAWLSEGILQIDDQGAACWESDAPASSGRFEPRQWFAGFGLIWIEGAVGMHRHRMLVSSAQLSDTDRARLQRWLRWLDRGGTSCKRAGESRSSFDPQ